MKIKPIELIWFVSIAYDVVKTRLSEAEMEK